jgi:hypothetical protein
MKDCWIAHWQQLLQYADPDISFANLRMRDVDALNLKLVGKKCCGLSIKMCHF